MRHAWTAAIAGAAMLSGCGDGEAARLERVRGLMNAHLEPAADGLWENAGYVLTSEGEESLFPETEAEWAAAIAAAERVKRVAIDMQDPAYAGADEQWTPTTLGLIDAADQAISASRARDEDAFFEAGGYLYRVCTSCHGRYDMRAVD